LLQLTVNIGRGGPAGEPVGPRHRAGS